MDLQNKENLRENFKIIDQNEKAFDTCLMGLSEYSGQDQVALISQLKKTTFDLIRQKLETIEKGQKLEEAMQAFTKISVPGNQFNNSNQAFNSSQEQVKVENSDNRNPNKNYFILMKQGKNQIQYMCVKEIQFQTLHNYLERKEEGLQKTVKYIDQNQI